MDISVNPIKNHTRGLTSYFTLKLILKFPSNLIHHLATCNICTVYYRNERSCFPDNNKYHNAEFDEICWIGTKMDRMYYPISRDAFNNDVIWDRMKTSPHSLTSHYGKISVARMLSLLALNLNECFFSTLTSYSCNSVADQ